MNRSKPESDHSSGPEAEIDHRPSDPGAKDAVLRGTASPSPTGDNSAEFARHTQISVGVAGWLRASGISTGLRLAWITGVTLLRLAIERGFGLVLSSPRRKRRQEAARAHIISRWVSLLSDLKGPFVKAGQFASLRHDIVSADVATALADLRDRVMPMQANQARAVIEQELGAPISDLLESFDPNPLGAASIAQAHRARLQDGSNVVIKVQYPWLRAALRADLRWLRWIVFIWLGRSRRNRSLMNGARFFEEFEASLKDELDFEREARAAVEIAGNLALENQVEVPTIVASHSTSRVLTMHYHPCVNIRDESGLERLGVDPAAIVEILARSYAKQIFVDGLFHADPHPGNLFILDEPEAAQRPRVLFVDFGLHRRLSPKLRRSLRLGIYALLQRDLEDFLVRMRELDMIAPQAEPDVRRAVSHMFERISEQGNSGSPIPVAGNQVLQLKDEAKALLQDTPGLQLPNDLLLYARTLSYLFAVGNELAPTTDVMKLSIPYLLQFLAERDS